MEMLEQSNRDRREDSRDTLPSVIAHLIAAKEIARFERQEHSSQLLNVIGNALDEAYRQVRLRTAERP